MPPQKLIEYIKEAKNHGKTDQEIKKYLLDNGWPEDDVDAALNQLSNSKQENNKTSFLEKIKSALSVYKVIEIIFYLSTFIILMIYSAYLFPVLFYLLLWTGGNHTALIMTILLVLSLIISLAILTSIFYGTFIALNKDVAKRALKMRFNGFIFLIWSGVGYFIMDVNFTADPISLAPIFAILYIANSFITPYKN